MSGQREAAFSVLGAQHPLARALALRAALTRDLLAVAALAVPLVLAEAYGLVGPAWPGVCTVAVLALAVASLAADTRVRERALELIADGEADVGLPSVARQRDRLMGDECRRNLASAFAALRALAQSPPPGAIGIHPRALLDVDAELRELERRIAAPGASASGVALAKRLLVARDSALYGRDPEPLRQELVRVTLALGGLRDEP